MLEPCGPIKLLHDGRHVHLEPPLVAAHTPGLQGCAPLFPPRRHRARNWLYDKERVATTDAVDHSSEKSPAACLVQLVDGKRRHHGGWRRRPGSRREIRLARAAAQ